MTQVPLTPCRFQQAILNPHHASEYLLAYNNGRVYYCFHWSFEKDFQRIAEQWCASKNVEFIGHYYALNDDAYPHVLTSKEAEPSPTHGSVIQSDDKRPEPLPQRRDDFKYSGDEELLVYQMSQSQPVTQQPQRLQPDSEQRYDSSESQPSSARSCVIGRCSKERGLPKLSRMVYDAGTATGQ